jgi:hypothetical protein
MDRKKRKLLENLFYLIIEVAEKGKINQRTCRIASSKGNDSTACGLALSVNLWDLFCQA